MKKRIALFLALMLMLAFAGCSQEKPVQTTGPKETAPQVTVQTEPLETQTSVSFATMVEFETFVSTILNLKHYDVDRAEDSLDYSLSVDAEYTLSNEITLGSQKLALPCTYQDILDAGWTATQELREVWEENATWYQEFANDQGKLVDIWWVNNGSETENVENVIWHGVQLELYVENWDTEQLEKNPEVPEFAYMGITGASTLQEVLRTLGEPEYISFYQYDETADVMVCYETKTEAGKLYLDLIFDAATGNMIEVELDIR